MLPKTMLRLASVTVAVLGFTLGAPHSARALILKDTSKTSSVTLRMKGQVFADGISEKIATGEFGSAYDLQRARLKLQFDYHGWLRVNIEPDFGGSRVDLADTFLELRPVRTVRVRLGRAKTPYGFLETSGRWDLPMNERGLVHDIFADRLGFSLREFGAQVRWRDKTLPLRPSVEVGLFGEAGTDVSQNQAARIGLRWMKGLHSTFAGYRVSGAGTAGGYGYITSASLLYDRKRSYIGADVHLGQTRLISPSVADLGVNATLLAARVVVAHGFKVHDDTVIQPFVDAQFFDPNADTTDDTNLTVGGGLNFIWRELFRFGFDVHHQTTSVGAVALDGTRIQGRVGVALE